VVDDSGTVLNHVVYDAFGGVTSQTDESVVFRYGYTARELDAESGLQYNRARYLDSFTGKFISEDPIGFGGGDANLYRYVFNQPITHLDPDGLQSRELSALFANSYKGASPTGNVLIYNTKFPTLSAAYHTAADWFEAIIIPPGDVEFPRKRTSKGTVVYQFLKDDTGKLSPPRAGLGRLRSFSTSTVGDEEAPTIELDVDDLKRRHSTPEPYGSITKVKFPHNKRDKDPDLCVYYTEDEEEANEREKARITVRNKILSSPSTPTQEPRGNFTLPDFSFPNIPIIPWFNPFERAI
jgi:RHS repeat-associated protein